MDVGIPFHKPDQKCSKHLHDERVAPQPYTTGFVHRVSVLQRYQLLGLLVVLDCTKVARSTAFAGVSYRLEDFAKESISPQPRPQEGTAGSHSKSKRLLKQAIVKI